MLSRGVRVHTLATTALVTAHALWQALGQLADPVDAFLVGGALVTTLTTVLTVRLRVDALIVGTAGLTRGTFGQARAGETFALLAGLRLTANGAAFTAMLVVCHDVDAAVGAAAGPPVSTGRSAVAGALPSDASVTSGQTALATPSTVLCVGGRVHAGAIAAFVGRLTIGTTGPSLGFGVRVGVAVTITTIGGLLQELGAAETQEQREKNNEFLHY